MSFEILQCASVYMANRVYKQEEDEEQGGMNTWENSFWEPWLHAKPKSPELYSRGDRWINWKPH